ncbi:TPA: hypothetical protein I7769_20985 [Vibrio vulnificus]|nr:hypothetical protein [Vibrio vulnificus]
MLNCRLRETNSQREQEEDNKELFCPSPNARLRGWQRITTKLKHNNHNHHGSIGLETPRVDSPS